MLLTQQRDEFSAKLSAAEDKESRSEAALINLQCALEQFQKSKLAVFLIGSHIKMFVISLRADKDRDIELATQRLRRDLAIEVERQLELANEIKSLKLQLQESKNGLLAAARISDQLENVQLANVNLRDERKYT